MKRGTKIGWLLIALSVILSVWVIVSQSSDASQTTESGLVLSDDGTVLEQYTGSGGTVTIPDGVTTISAGVFKEKDVTQVIMPSSVTSMGTGVFSGCSSLASVSLSTSLNSIPEDSFRECLSLGSVTIPDSATTIASNAFYGCASLSSVSIPASVSNISTDAFSGCGNLSDISVASGNGAYASSDGCLYNASKTRLLLVPEGKTSLAIAAGTTTIGAGALQNCTGISSVSLPNGVTTIEANAFSDSAVETITIPATVTSIASQGSWKPSTIYGASGSAAEQYAKNNGIVFVVQGNEPDPDAPGDNGNGGNDNPGNNGGTTGDNGNAGNNGNAGGNGNGGTAGDNGNAGNNGNGGTTNSGDVVNPDGSITHADGSVTTADGKVIKSASATGGASHTKDATPTTADGIDPRYFLCLAIFAGGIGVILYSRFNKMRYLSENHKKRS